MRSAASAAATASSAAAAAAAAAKELPLPAPLTREERPVWERRAAVRPATEPRTEMIGWLGGAGSSAGHAASACATSSPRLAQLPLRMASCRNSSVNWGASMLRRPASLILWKLRSTSEAPRSGPRSPQLRANSSACAQVMRWSASLKRRKSACTDAANSVVAINER